MTVLTMGLGQERAKIEMLARLDDRVPPRVGGQEKDDARVGTVCGTIRVLWTWVKSCV